MHLFSALYKFECTPAALNNHQITLAVQASSSCSVTHMFLNRIANVTGKMLYMMQVCKFEAGSLHFTDVKPTGISFLPKTECRACKEGSLHSAKWQLQTVRCLAHRPLFESAAAPAVARQATNVNSHRRDAGTCCRLLIHVWMACHPGEHAFLRCTYLRFAPTGDPSTSNL